MLIQESINSQIEIKAKPELIWDALINPEIVKNYLYGTKLISNWKLGSEISFTGEWEGTKYLDRGTIQELIPNQCLSYTYLSSFSGLPDEKENYSLITFQIVPKLDFFILSLTQKGFTSQQAKEHSQSSWDSILKQIKEIVEGNSF